MLSGTNVMFRHGLCNSNRCKVGVVGSYVGIGVDFKIFIIFGFYFVWEIEFVLRQMTPQFAVVVALAAGLALLLWTVPKFLYHLLTFLRCNFMLNRS